VTENGRGKERKMNGGPATVSQKRDREKGLKQKLLQKERAMKIFNHETSPPNVTLII
jgi:hypothetical protein